MVSTSPVPVGGLPAFASLYANEIAWPPTPGRGVLVAHAVILSVEDEQALAVTPGPRVLIPLQCCDIPGHLIKPQFTAVLRMIRRAPLDDGPVVVGAAISRALVHQRLTVPRQKVKSNGNLTGFTVPAAGLPQIPASVEIPQHVLTAANLAPGAVVGTQVCCTMGPEVPFGSTSVFRASLVRRGSNQNGGEGHDGAVVTR